MSIQFNLKDGKQVHIERESIEERILEGVLDKLQEARENEPGLYNGFKQAVNILKLVGGVKMEIPKGENALEYLLAHFLHIGLDSLENHSKPLEVYGKVVDPNASAD